MPRWPPSGVDPCAALKSHHSTGTHQPLTAERFQGEFLESPWRYVFDAYAKKFEFRSASSIDSLRATDRATIPPTAFTSMARGGLPMSYGAPAFSTSRGDVPSLALCWAPRPSLGSAVNGLQRQRPPRRLTRCATGPGRPARRRACRVQRPPRDRPRGHAGTAVEPARRGEQALQRATSGGGPANGRPALSGNARSPGFGCCGTPPWPPRTPAGRCSWGQRWSRAGLGLVPRT